MDISKFYGTEEGSTFSYLEFGSINLKEGKKEIWDFRLHEKAYDWLMLARYTNDMVTYMSMTEDLGKNPISKAISLYCREMHHKADASINFGKLCALAVMKNHLTSRGPSFFELGQTIFGCIEGMEFCRKLLETTAVQFPFLDLSDIKWYGVDISEIFNRLSIKLHSGYKVKTMREIEKLNEQAEVFFAKGVTLLYIVRKTSDLMDILDKGKLCIFDYSFALGEEQNATIGTGKSVKYINFDDFYSYYKKGTKKLYLRKEKSHYNKAKNRIFIDCIYAEENICKEFIKLDMRIRDELIALLSSEQDASVLLDAESEDMNWQTIDDFISEVKK